MVMGELVNAVQKFWTKDKGASLPEYALLLVLIAVVSVAVLTAFGSSLSNLFSTAATTI
jgi:pilus assembly protein Flp/PilA